MSDFIEEKYFQKMNDLNFKLLCEIDRICKKYGIKYYLAYGTLLGAIRHKDLIPWDDDMDLIITDKELKKFISHADELSDEFMLVKPTDYGEDVYFDSIVRVNLKNTRICPEGPEDDYYHGLRSNLAIDFFVLTPVPSGIRGLIHRAHLFYLFGMANAYRYSEYQESDGAAKKLVAKLLKPLGRLYGIKRLRAKIDKLMLKYEGRNDLKEVFVCNSSVYDMMKRFRKSDFRKMTTATMRDREFPIPAGYDNILKVCYGDYMELPPEDQRRWHLVDPESFSYEE